VPEEPAARKASGLCAPEEPAAIKASGLCVPEEPAATKASGPCAPEQPAGPRSTIGILGGTFNPPHRGHLALARHARAELGLERVLLMPAHSAPHKGDEGDPGPRQRLEMCRLAVGDEVGLQVCGLEIERGGPSYTVDTLRAIHESHPQAELTFVVGADMARTLPTWREPQELVELAKLAVAEREDAGCEDVSRALAPLRAEVAFLGMPPVEISSSLVRERVAEGRPVEELVAKAVAEYIAEHRLYRAPVATEAVADTKATASQAKAHARAKAAAK
jgi:nicotinate-nucleotide adenylyltransferase